MIGKVLAGLGLAATIGAAPAWAGHSTAMFDMSKEIVVSGAVKQFQYTAPNSWLLVDVVSAEGRTSTWSFETGPPSTLLRSGIKSSTLRKGDTVTITGHPLKDGRPAGTLVTVTKAGTRFQPPRQ